MLIVSNEPINKTEKKISYDEFLEKALSDEGFNVDDTLYFNAADIQQEIYEALEGQNVKFFTINGTKPPFIKEEIEEWDNDAKEGTIDATGQSPMSNAESFGVDDMMLNTLNSFLEDNLSESADENTGGNNAKVYVFGSSKGGTGKTFTAIESTYRYGITHPYQRIAFIDFDIIDGQVGISIHKRSPNLKDYYREFQKEYSDFNTMHNFSVKANPPYPQNVDFYLAPHDGTVINNNDFWLNIIENVVSNYDVVVLDTGIDYLNISPISYAYKIADKIILVSTGSIKSTNSVAKQILKLKGEVKNPTFFKEDGLDGKIYLVLTQLSNDKKMNNTVISVFQNRVEIIAKFGIINDSVNKAEFFGEWDIFDKNEEISKAFDRIMA